MFELNNRVAIVTGAAGGIGKETCLTLAELGADVVATDVSSEIEKVRGEVEQTGSRSLAFEADVRNPDEILDIVNETIDEFKRIDILVNVAGIFPYQPLSEIDNDDWEAVLEVNLTGTFNWAQAVLPVMRDQGYGRIVNISSATGGHSGRSGNFAHYAASKAGVVGFTRSVAIDVGPDGITMNAILPGIIDTGGLQSIRPKEEIEATVEQTPARRMGQPEDVAHTVAFLAAEESGYITGTTLLVDGGSTLL